MFWKAEIEHFQENRVRAFAGVFVDTVTPAKHGDFSKIGIELLRGGGRPANFAANQSTHTSNEMQWWKLTF